MLTINLTEAQLSAVKMAVLDKIERLQHEQRDPELAPFFAQSSAEREAEMQAINAILQAAG